MGIFWDWFFFRTFQRSEVIFEHLDVWRDPVLRKGPEAMAVDELLLGMVRKPLLRVYGWLGNWVSLGYFGKIAEARILFQEVDFVRRWTGGGMVDHRLAWTYSLLVPVETGLEKQRVAESYALIHEALAHCLRAEGEYAILSGDRTNIGNVCFDNPVKFDVLDKQGRKLAGAAQRRCRTGLLHQGSVAVSGGVERPGNFAGFLAESWQEKSIQMDETSVARLMESKYGCKNWLEKR